MDAVIERVKSLFAPTPSKSFMVWKEAGGYRWFAVYSNKYRDKDNPPEILSSHAHLSFVDKVDKGVLPYPTLLHYHIPGSRWGKSDWLAYDERGFVMASGTIDPGHEKEAEAVMALPEQLAVSHGLEVRKRNDKDGSIIEEYETYEISDLPLGAAANKLTGFVVIGEGVKDMGIPDQKKHYLRKVGLTDDDIGRIEADIEGKSKVAEEAGLDSKEAPPPEEVQKDVETPVAEPLAQPYATREEVATAIVEAVRPLADALATLTGAITTMAKSDEERIATKAADTPALSIAALITKQMSAIGKDEARVTVDEMRLAKDKPLETESHPSTTGIPFIDQMLAKPA